MTWSQWMPSLDMFIVHVCETWNLFTGLDDSISAPDSPHDSNRRHDQEGDSKDRLVFAGIVPAAHELSDTVASCIQWYRSYKSFLFVTDSQILQRVVCGHCSMDDDQYRPLLSRIVDRIALMLASGWIPPQVWDDPVRWMPREYNKVADGLADFTMDRQTSWSREFSTSRAASDCNIIVQTDGGVRGGDCAASAFIIGICGRVDDSFFFEPLLVQGTYMTAHCSSFAAEAIALDEATSALERFFISGRLAQPVRTSGCSGLPCS